MEYNVSYFREELKDFVKWQLKASHKPYQAEAKRLLSASDEDIAAWIEEHQRASFLAYYCNETTKKSDKAKYNRLKRKAKDWDFEEFTEDEEEFILLYEEENNITESIIQ